MVKLKSSPKKAKTSAVRKSRKAVINEVETVKSRAKVVHNQYISVNTMKLKEVQDYLLYVSSLKRILWINFLVGTARGLGFIVGTVIVLAVLTFFISQVLSEIPWIGESFRWLDDWLRENIDTYSTNGH
jgi:hypothetical protein